MTDLVIPSGCSKIQLLWLEDVMRREGISIQHALSSNSEHYIKGIGYVDGFCSSTNTVYEFHGSYWHGDPKLFPSESVHPIIGKTYGNLYQATLARDEAIKDKGYNLIAVWESEVDCKSLRRHYFELKEKYGKVRIRIASQPREKTNLTVPEKVRLPIRETEMSDQTLTIENAPLSTMLCKEFIDEHYDRCSESVIGSNGQIMYKQYSEWCSRKGYQPPSKSKLHHTVDILYGGLQCLTLKAKYVSKSEKVDLRDKILLEDKLVEEQCQRFLDANYTILPRGDEASKKAMIKATEIWFAYSNWIKQQDKPVEIGKTRFYYLLDSIIGRRIRSGCYKYVGIVQKG